MQMTVISWTPWGRSLPDDRSEDRNVPHPPPDTPVAVVCCPGHAGVKGNDRADRMVGIGCTVLDMPETKGMTEQIDWQV